jgi:hypothetical protein
MQQYICSYLLICCCWHVITIIVVDDLKYTVSLLELLLIRLLLLITFVAIQQIISSFNNQKYRLILTDSKKRAKIYSRLVLYLAPQFHGVLSAISIQIPLQLDTNLLVQVMMASTTCFVFYCVCCLC